MTKLKNMKKWQKIAIIIMIILTSIFASLKIFKEQIIPIMLNKEEMAAYDFYKKSCRVYGSLGYKTNTAKHIEYGYENGLLWIMVEGKAEGINTIGYGTYMQNFSTIGNMVFFMDSSEVEYDEDPSVSINDIKNSQDIYAIDKVYYDFFDNNNSIDVRLEELTDEHSLKEYLDNYNIVVNNISFYKILIMNL